MDDKQKKLKVGVRLGGGPEPGYFWNVGIYQLAYEEAITFLTPGMMRHLAMQVKELASQSEATNSLTVDVRHLDGDVYEIRDTGGILGGINVRVIYGVDKTTRTIIVLDVFKKQNNGKTPLGDKVRNLRRWRQYRNGEFGTME